MKAAKIYIKETEKYIDLSANENFPFTLTKSIAEIEDVSKRNKTHSRTFKIPATDANVKAFGFPHVLGTDLDDVNVYKQQCLIIVNGNVIDEGYIYILKSIRGVMPSEFECQFVGGNEPWVVALQSLMMSDITSDTNNNVLEVDYDDDEVRARFNTDPTTLADPSYIFVNPYMYQFSDGQSSNWDNSETYEGTSRAAIGADFWPAFRVDHLVDGIFGTATNPLVQTVFGFDSFQLDSSFFTDNATHGFWNNIYYSDRSQDEYSVTFNGPSPQWGRFLQKDVSMLEFFMRLCQTFNLVFSFDGITLKVEPRQDWKSWNGTTYTGFYSGNVDWSDKTSVDQQIDFKTSNYKRRVRLSWETDNYPIDPNMYPFINDRDVSQPEVRYIIDTDSNNEEGITDIRLPFNTSLSKFYQAKFDHRRTSAIAANGVGTVLERNQLQSSDSITFSPEAAYSNRLFVFKVGTAPMGIMYYGTDTAINSPGSYDFVESYLYRPTWRKWVYQESDGTEHVQSDWPFMYNCMTIDPYHHRDRNIFYAPGSITTYDTIFAHSGEWDTIENVDVSDVTITRDPSNAIDLGAVTDIESNSIDDINLGIYKANTVDMPEGIYERFWQQTIESFITTRTLKTKVLLTRNEFVNLDISKFYTLLGQRFILNKVSDFDPMLDEQMVDVELLQYLPMRGSDVVEAPEVTLLLDTYGEDCAAAYSVRKLRSDYSGSAIRVRRSSDDTEQDIGFDVDGNLDESALTTFVGSNTGYIVTWYDQTTNGNNATQPFFSRQMRIVSVGVVDKIGTRIAPIATATRTHYVTGSIITVTPPQTSIVVVKPTVTSGNYHMIGENQTGTYRFGGHDDRLFLNGGSLISTADGAISQPHMVAVGLANGASSSIRANGSQLATGNTSGNNYSINAVFGAYNSTSNMRGNMQEMLIYTADKSTDISAIETDINTYYSVY